jgi:RNA recognition motif-containing protein
VVIRYAAQPPHEGPIIFQGHEAEQENSAMPVKLYVGNLPYNTSEDDLRQLFEQAGSVVSVAVIRDRDSGRSKGFGFVEMGSNTDAQNAISRFNNYNLGERPLTVNPARPREERGGMGGGRDRRGSSGGTRRY